MRHLLAMLVLASLCGAGTPVSADARQSDSAVIADLLNGFTIRLRQFSSGRAIQATICR